MLSLVQAVKFNLIQNEDHLWTVYALDFFHALGGRKPIDPLPADAIPAVEGLTLTKPLAETWTPSDRIVIERVANAYGVTPAEAQKIGALLMVFLGEDYRYFHKDVSRKFQG